MVSAVAKGGVITFNCGPQPVTIKMAATARVFNDKPDVVIDGGGRVTLDGQDARRILYMNTCDPDLVWTTDHCQNQAHPTLTVQNLAFVNGRSSGHETMDGGGAIFVRGGRFRAVNAGFYGNHCASTGPDIGGASIQVFSQHDGLPVYVVNSTFGGSGSRRNECSNAGGISSIGVSWTILNSVFTGNRAIGTGANPPKDGKPGGGNGGAIYNDGNEMTLRVARDADRGQLVEPRGRQRDLLREQQPHRLGGDRRLGAPQQRRRRLPDLPRDLLPGRLDHVHQLDGRVGPAARRVRRQGVKPVPEPDRRTSRVRGLTGSH